MNAYGSDVVFCFDIRFRRRQKRYAPRTRRTTPSVAPMDSPATAPVDMEGEVLPGEIAAVTVCGVKEVAFVGWLVIAVVESVGVLDALKSTPAAAHISSKTLLVRFCSKEVQSPELHSPICPSNSLTLQVQLAVFQFSQP